MADGYLGEIRLFPYPYAPQGWMYCNGQILQIQQYPAVFAVIGTAYGGDGNTTFGLPNLQGKVPVGKGQAPGLSAYAMGMQGGLSTLQLTADNLPEHTHSLKFSPAQAGDASPDNQNVPGQLVQVIRGRKMAKNAYSDSTPTTPMNPKSLTTSGGNGVQDNRQPFIVIPFCICMEGMFPTRP